MMKVVPRRQMAQQRDSKWERNVLRAVVLFVPGQARTLAQGTPLGTLVLLPGSPTFPIAWCTRNFNSGAYFCHLVWSEPTERMQLASVEIRI